MRLSSAIKKGCEGTTKLQKQYFNKEAFIEKEIKACCSLGAAMKSLLEENNVLPGDLKALELLVNTYKFLGYKPNTRKDKIPKLLCGCNNYGLDIFSCITHMNDSHNFSREEIACWVENLENLYME